MNEHRQHIEQDPAIERQFEPILVGAPSAEDTISILRGLRERFELHPGVGIQDHVLVGAAQLSDRYLSERLLPGKAIDLVDEACAMVRTEIDSMPAELDETTRRVLQLEIEAAALESEKDPASTKRLEELRKDLADLKGRSDEMRMRWEAEKETLDSARSLREQIAESKREVEQAEAKYDLSRATELEHGHLPELEQQLEDAEAAVRGSDRMLTEDVTDSEIADIVSRWTGVPVSRLVEDEREKLMRLDDVLHERLVGQDEAVRSVVDTVTRARAGIKDPDRPIGSFIFLSPTEVGKTKLARTLALTLFDSVERLVRIYMSEYMEKRAVSRLIGAPPG